MGPQHTTYLNTLLHIMCNEMQSSGALWDQNVSSKMQQDLNANAASYMSAV